MPIEKLPTSESLEMTIERVLPYWEKKIRPKAHMGKRTIVIGHGNALRGLIKHLSGMSHEEILNFEIPTACPLVYNFDANMRPLEFRYLLDEYELKERLEDYRHQIESVDDQIR